MNQITHKIFSHFSYDLGIDLGTANTLVYVKDKGIVIDEPSVVAINQKTKQILAIGNEARRMVGKTPPHITAARPLVDGVISEFEVTEQMLRYFIGRVQQQGLSFLRRPRVVVGVPSGVTEVEKRAVVDATLSAGARQAFLIEEPMAAAIGARLPVEDPAGSMIVDIGGGTSEIAVISLGGVVVSRSMRIAGDEMNENIIQFARDKYNLLLGERTAEEVKISIGSASSLDQPLETVIRGRDLVSGLPKEIKIDDGDIRNALARSVRIIVNNVKDTLEETPPELVADIMTRGVVLAGGGALLKNLDKLIEEETQMPVRVADDPLTAVARGAGMVLEELDTLAAVLVDTEFEKAPN